MKNDDPLLFHYLASLLNWKLVPEEVMQWTTNSDYIYRKRIERRVEAAKKKEKEDDDE